MTVLTYAATALLTALVIYLLVVGNPILLPLVIAVFIWHLINALATLSRRIRVGGVPLPGVVRFGGALLILLSGLWFMTDLAMRNIGAVTAAMSTYERNLNLRVARIGDLLGLELEDQPSVRAMLDKVDMNERVRSLAISMTALIGSAGTVLIYVVFLLLEQSSFGRKLAALVPDPDRQALVHRIVNRIRDEVQTYVWLKTVTSVLTAVGSYVVLRLVGVDFAAFWALLIFALNYIPYIGAFIGVVFPTALALVQFETLTPFIATFVALTVVQLTTGSILEPRIMGKGLNLSPLVMLLSLAVWGSIWGVVGMFLAVPLMVMAMIVCSHFPATRPVAILLSADGQLRS